MNLSCKIFIHNPYVATGENETSVIFHNTGRILPITLVMSFSKTHTIDRASGGSLASLLVDNL